MSWNPSDSAARKLIAEYSRMGKSCAPEMASVRDAAPIRPPRTATSPRTWPRSRTWDHARQARYDAPITHGAATSASFGGFHGGLVPGTATDAPYSALADHHESPS